MQTAKAILVMLICTGILAACGLKGPLYLPQDDATSQLASEPEAEQPGDDEDEDENEKDSRQVPVSIR